MTTRHPDPFSGQKLAALVLLAFAALFLIFATGCQTVDTKDVTKIVVTTTGIKIAKGEISQTPELILGRSQVEYLKVPASTNGDFPEVSSGYKVTSKLKLFGTVQANSTLSVSQTNTVRKH